MKNFIIGMLSDHSGKISLMRTISAIWVLGILFCIIFLVLTNKTFPVISPEVLYSVVGVLGAKAYQSSKELQQKV